MDSLGVILQSMGNLGQENDTPTLAQEAIVGLLFAISHAEAVPARPWPVVAACQTLAKRLHRQSPYSRAALEAAHGLAGGSRVESWLHGLAREGHLQPHGRGVSACWVASERWVEDWRVAAAGLPVEEQRIWAAGSQSLTNSVSMWRNTLSVAALQSSPSEMQ